MLSILCFALFLPLIGFLILMLTSSFISRFLAGTLATSFVFLSFLAFVSLLVLYMTNHQQSQNFILFNWISTQEIVSNFKLHLDGLSLLMGLIITGVGFLIHLYSNGYMDHEEDYARFFAFLNFFIFSMLLLVLAGDLLVLFIGWEGVGLASYLLIGFWYTRPAAAQAATKAFVINRIGDLGLLLGLILTFYLFGTTDIEQISQQAKMKFAVGAPIMTVLTLLYFVGATGKSAQLPLYTWLPDAMEGPTPVSALIHAATMVTAGVYLIVRLHEVFLLAPFTLQIVGIVGAVTSLFAALCALSQTDLKRVLAYSTVSQLGLMFMACGAGAFFAAMFHLTTHAFIKALLFLSAGNVVHMMHGTTEMNKMGGLSKLLPKTNLLFLIGSLALAGIPPLAAFFSKDLILEHEYLAGHKFLFLLGLIVSLLTGFYLMRAYFLTFQGDSKENHYVSEAPSIMTAPVSVLALLSIIGGVLGYSFGQSPLLASLLHQIGLTPIEEELKGGFVMTPETWIAIAGSLIGVGGAAWIYSRYTDHLSSISLFRNSFYVNEIYHAVIVKPLEKISDFFAHLLEPKFFQGMIDEVSKGINKIAGKLQQFQSGQIRSYLAWMVLGTVLLITYLMI